MDSYAYLLEVTLFHWFGGSHYRYPTPKSEQFITTVTDDIQEKPLTSKKIGVKGKNHQSKKL